MSRTLRDVTGVQDLVTLTPVFVDVENGWVQARFAELPAVITAAPSRAEAEDMLIDALREFLLSFGPADPVRSDDSPTMTVTLRAG